MIELALIKLTRPQMEQSMDSVLERLEQIEKQLADGAFYAGASGAYPAAGNGVPAPGFSGTEGAGAAAAGMGAQSGDAGFSGAAQAPSEAAAFAPGDIAPGGYPAAGIPAPEPKTVSLPKAQLEDLNLIRNEWGKIVKELGMSIRPSFRETVVEPSGESCLCIVFNDPMNFTIGSRPVILGDLERYVEKTYGKSMYFKARLRETGERLDTRLYQR